MIRKSTTLVQVNAECVDCGKQFTSRNAQALAAQHCERYGHEVIGEVYLIFRHRPAKENDHVVQRPV